MTKITILNETESSPRQTFLKEFNTAFATGNAKFIIDHIDKDIVWWIYGDKKLEGKEAFAQEVHSMKEYVADELVLHGNLVQGQKAVVNGEIRMAGKTYAFCDVYNFKNDKYLIIKEIRSFVVEIKVE